MPPLLVISLLCIFHNTQREVLANACGSIQTVLLDKYSGTIELMFEPKLNGTDGNVTWMYNYGGFWERERTAYERIENTQFIAQFHVNIDSTRHEFHAEFTYSTGKCLSSLLTVTMTVELQRPVFNNIKDLANCSSCLLGKEQDYLRIECIINTESIFVRVDLYVGGRKLKSSVKHGHYIGYIFLSASQHLQEVKCEVFHSKHNVTLVATAHIYVEEDSTPTVYQQNTIETEQFSAHQSTSATPGADRNDTDNVTNLQGDRRPILNPDIIYTIVGVGVIVGLCVFIVTVCWYYRRKLEKYTTAFDAYPVSPEVLVFREKKKNYNRTYDASDDGASNLKNHQRRTSISDRISEGSECAHFVLEPNQPHTVNVYDNPYYVIDTNDSATISHDDGSDTTNTHATVVFDATSAAPGSAIVKIEDDDIVHVAQADAITMKKAQPRTSIASDEYDVLKLHGNPNKAKQLDTGNEYDHTYDKE